MDMPTDPVFSDAAAMVAALRPEEPVYCLRPQALRAAARAFAGGFPGQSLYAVKCNPEPAFLDPLYDGGIRHFDTASLAEVALIKERYADAGAYFMHPVKPRSAIREAFHRYGVRHFALDHPDELAKIRQETGGASDVVMMVRLATARGGAVYDLGGKFGCGVEAAAELLNAALAGGQRVGLCFHVGSQCLNPGAYKAAMALVRMVLERAPAHLDVVDVGGGFPAAYVGVALPPLEQYFAAIREGMAGLGLPSGCALWCEPGRALVAQGASLVVRVDLRRGTHLYVSDGVYGSLSDLRMSSFHFPMRALRIDGKLASDLEEYSLFGPTCDPADEIRGPFRLPADLREGDYIEIGQAGAYTTALRTRFNGFFAGRIVTVLDEPLMPSADMVLAPLRTAAE